MLPILTEKEIVVFESLYKGDRELAVHADIEDEGQTIFFLRSGQRQKMEVMEIRFFLLMAK